MLFPIEQRHASPRNGAAIEFVQHEPSFVGVELAGCDGSYFMIFVDVASASIFCVEDGFPVVEEIAVAEEDGNDGAFTIVDPENEKNFTATITIAIRRTMTAKVLYELRIKFYGKILCAQKERFIKT